MTDKIKEVLLAEAGTWELDFSAYLDSLSALALELPEKVYEHHLKVAFPVLKAAQEYYRLK